MNGELLFTLLFLLGVFFGGASVFVEDNEKLTTIAVTLLVVALCVLFAMVTK